MLRSWPVLLFFALALAITSRAAPESPGAALLRAHREVGALQVRIRAEAESPRGKQETVTLVAFRRPLRFRVELQPPARNGLWVQDENGLLIWFPAQNGFRRWSRAEGWASNWFGWDGFDSPAWSFVTLLEPPGEWGRVLERTWATRLYADGEETVGGEPCSRLRGRGGRGAPLRLWVSRRDGLLRQAQLGPWPDEQGNVHSTLARIEILARDAEVPAAALTFQLPEGARDLNQRPPSRGGFGGQGPALPPGEDLAPLERRLALQPNDPAALRDMAQYCISGGQSARAALLLLRLAGTATTPAATSDVIGRLSAPGLEEPALRLLIGALARPGDYPHVAPSLVLHARRFRLEAPLRAALVKAVAREPASDGNRLLLADLLIESGDLQSGISHLARAVDEARRGGGARGDRLLDLLLERTGSLFRDCEAWPQAERKRLAAGLSAIDGRVSGEQTGELLRLYRRLGALAEAVKLVRRAPEESLEADDLGRLGVALWESGDSAGARRLFREALATTEGEGHPDLDARFGILAYPHAVEALAAEFRQQVERRKGTLAEGHWLALAGDDAGAARAYAAYLESAAAEPPNAAARERLAAAAGGLRALSRAGAASAALRERFLALAVAELPFLAAEGGFSEAPVRAPLLRMARLLPDPGARHRWLTAVLESGAEGSGEFSELLSSASIDGFSREETASLVHTALERLSLSELAGLARTICDAGFEEEAIALVERGLREAPRSVDLQALDDDRITAKAGARLSRALEGAVAAHPDWTEGALALVRLRTSTDEKPRAIELLKQLASRNPSGADSLRLAAMLQDAGDLTGAAELYRKAAAQAPSDGDLQLRLAGTLEKLGRKEEALAIYQALRGKAHPFLAAPIAEGLCRCGAASDALSLLEEALAKARSRSGWLLVVSLLRDALAQQYVDSRRMDAALRLYPEVEVYERFSSGRSLGAIPFRLPATLVPLVVARFDREKKPEAAARAELAALLPGRDTTPDWVPYIRPQAPGPPGPFPAAIPPQSPPLAKKTVPGPEPSGTPGSRTHLVERARARKALPFLRDLVAARLEGDPAPELQLVLARVELEAGARTAAGGRYRRLLLPEGAALPHLSKVAAEACAGYAEVLAAEGKGPEADIFRRRARALALMPQEGDPPSLQSLREALPLFSDSPCLRFLEAEIPDPTGARLRWEAALLALAHAYAGSRSCPVCSAALTRLPKDLNLPALLDRADPAGAAAIEAHLADRPAGSPGKSAVGRWKRITERFPEWTAGWEGLREVADEDGEDQIAAAAAVKVAELLRDDPEAWKRAVDACEEAELPAEYRRAAARLRELDPDFVWETPDEADFELGPDQEALRDVIRLDPLGLRVGGG